MTHNKCKNCGADKGRAGNLYGIPSKGINNFCKSCLDTKLNQALTLHTNLPRTSEEVKRIASLVIN